MSKIRTFRVAAAFLPAISAHRAMADGVAHFAVRHGDWILCTLHTRPDARPAFPALSPDNFDGAIGDFTQPPFSRLLAAGASSFLYVGTHRPCSWSRTRERVFVSRIKAPNAPCTVRKTNPRVPVAACVCVAVGRGRKNAVHA